MISSLFIANGSVDIGMGHLYRVRNIIRQIISEKREIAVTLLTIDFSGSKQFIEEHMNFDIEIIYIPDDVDEREHYKFLKKNSYDFIIFDKLNNELGYIESFSQIGKKLITIDDLIDNTHIVSKKINLLVNGQNNTYKDKSIIFENIKFLPIEKKFIDNRKAIIRKKVISILVSMGGSDPNGLTIRILKIIDSFRSVRFTVIIGPNFKYKNELDSIIENLNSNIDIVYNTHEIENYMVESDIAICSGGTTIYELAAIGTPSIVLCQNMHEATNKFPIYDINMNLGLHDLVTDNEIKLKIKTLMTDYQYRYRLYQNGIKLIDGLGLKRLTDLIFQ